jgi:hypothetical protein
MSFHFSTTTSIYADNAMYLQIFLNRAFCSCKIDSSTFVGLQGVISAIVGTSNIEQLHTVARGQVCLGYFDLGIQWKWGTMA